MPRRLNSVSATGNPSWGLAMVDGQQEREEGAGKDQGRPLHRQQASPIRIGQKYQQAMIAVAAEAKGQQGRADAVEQSARDLRAQPTKGNSKNAAVSGYCSSGVS